METFFVSYNSCNLPAVLSVLWRRFLSHITDDTTGKLQLLYGTINGPIQLMIQLVSYSCYIRQKCPHTTDDTTGK